MSEKKAREIDSSRFRELDKPKIFKLINNDNRQYFIIMGEKYNF